MAYSNRRPYLGLKKSLTEFFSAPVRYLKESSIKESQFEKPYLASDYPSMHLDIPKPDWPTWKFPLGNIHRPPSGAIDANLAGKCGPCSIYIDSNFGDCTQPVEVHAAVYCTWTPYTPTDRMTERKTKSGYVPDANHPAGKRRVTKEVSGVAAGDTILTIDAVVGEIAEIVPGFWVFLGPSAAVYLNPAVDKHVLLATMIDGVGNICTGTIEIDCACCPAETTFEFDDASTEDTIVRENSITVYVTGGCSKYTWSVAGTGFTLDNATTSTKYNTLNADNTACGTATITITDDCGTVITAEIRCTTGTWGSRIDECSDGTTGGNVYNCEVISGGTKKYFEWAQLSSGSCADEEDDCDVVDSTNYCDEWYASDYDCSGLSLYCKDPPAYALCRGDNQGVRIRVAGYYTWSCA